MWVYSFCVIHMCFDWHAVCRILHMCAILHLSSERRVVYVKQQNDFQWFLWKLKFNWSIFFLQLKVKVSSLQRFRERRILSNFNFQENRWLKNTRSEKRRRHCVCAIEIFTMRWIIWIIIINWFWRRTRTVAHRILTGKNHFWQSIQK